MFRNSCTWAAGVLVLLPVATTRAEDRAPQVIELSLRHAPTAARHWIAPQTTIAVQYSPLLSVNRELRLAEPLAADLLAGSLLNHPLAGSFVSQTAMSGQASAPPVQASAVELDAAELLRATSVNLGEVPSYRAGASPFLP